MPEVGTTHALVITCSLLVNGGMSPLIDIISCDMPELTVLYWLMVACLLNDISC